MSVFGGRFERVVFIVSSGRTGTKALAHHLGKCYESVFAVHEPRPSWRLRRASGRAICGRMSAERLASLLARSRRSLVSGISQSIYVESNPFLWGFLEAFAEVFDHPLVLHVVRDPRTYVRSAINWGACRGIKNLANTYLPYWHPHPEQLSASDIPWKQMTDIQRMAWYWKIVNTELNRGEIIHGSRYLRMRFEDLFNRDGSGLRQFAAWVGIPWKDDLLSSANAEKVNASQGVSCPPFKQWPEDQQEEALFYCRELMRLYGYEVLPAARSEGTTA